MQGTVAGRDCERNLKNVLAEASQALARLDAERLEEMALSCEALVDGSEVPDQHDDFRCWNTAGDMAIFRRVLEATRANLKVMRRLHEMRVAQLPGNPGGAAEYGNN